MISAPGIATAIDPEIEAAERFVESIGGASRLPAFVKNVRSISTVAADLQVRVQLLETEIIKDAALTSRVLRIAGALGQGAKIPNVKQAIIMLGYDRVTNLAASAAVFDSVERGATEVQNLLALSILTANQSLCMAVEARHGRPELAYLCGLFSNLGELMAALYRKTQYKEWSAARTPASPHPDGSEAKHFGFSFETVAIMLGREWGLPSELVQSLKRLPPPREAPRDRLIHIAQFSHDLTHAIYASPSQDAPDPAVEEVITLYAGPLNLDRKAIDRAIAEARRESTPIFRQMQLTIDGWRRARLKAAAAQESGATGGDAAAAGTDAQATAALATAGGPPAASRGPRAAPTANRPATGQSLSELTTLALSAGIGAGFTRGVLALSNEQFTDVRARIGLGDGHDALLQDFVIRTGSADTPLAAALASRNDVFLDLHDDDPATAVYRTDATLVTTGARCFALLPLVLSGRAVGCLYFDAPHPVDGSDESRMFLAGARRLLLAAFARQRAGAVA